MQYLRIKNIYLLNNNINQSSHTKYTFTIYLNSLCEFKIKTYDLSKKYIN